VPSKYIYIEDAFALDRNTGSVRAFLLANSFKQTEDGDFRRIAATGSCQDHSARVRQYHALDDFRTRAFKIQEKRKRQQESEYAQQQRQIIERLQKMQVDDTDTKQEDEEEAERVQMQTYDKAEPAREMTDAEYEDRQLRSKEAAEARAKAGVGVSDA
jgi:uncharacterized protein YkuJ